MAIAIGAIVLVSSLYILNAGLLGAMRTRQTQQATAVANEAIERVRDIDYDDIVLDADDVAGDPTVAGGLFDPDAQGPLLPEPVVTAPSAPALSPHIVEESAEGTGTTFAVSTYVTWIDATTQGGANQDLKRVTVVVDHTSGGLERSMRMSTRVAASVRGLPDPEFEVIPAAQTVTVEPDGTVVFQHTVRNLGVIDTIDLDMPAPAGKSWSIAFYHDTNVNGTFDPATDTALTDTNANATVDTGSLDTDHTAAVFAVWSLPASEPPGTTNLTLTGTSGRDPEFAETATDTLVVGGAGLVLTLHNDPWPPIGDTTAQKNTDMTEDPTAAPSLFMYSTNNYTGAQGRYVNKKNATATENDVTYMANWVYQFGQDTELSGTARLQVWVAVKDLQCDKVVQFRVFLRDKSSASSSTGTLIAQTTGTFQPQGPAPCTFGLVEVLMPVTYTIDRNRWIELKLTVDEVTGDAGLFAYDTTGYTSTLSLPRTAS